MRSGQNLPPRTGNASRGGWQGSPEGSDSRPVEVLLVVADSHDVRPIRDALDLAGIVHCLTATTDRMEALSYLLRRGNFSRMPRPDVIILDVELPGQGALALIESIGAVPKLRGIPAVLLGSAQAQLDWDRERGRIGTRFLVRPLVAEDICAELAFIGGLGAVPDRQ